MPGAECNWRVAIFEDAIGKRLQQRNPLSERLHRDGNVIFLAINIDPELGDESLDRMC